MKVLLYTEGLKHIRKSGLGKAIKHQMKALDENKIEWTTNLNDEYDILHINFFGPKSYFYAKKAKKNGKKIVYHAHSTEEDFRNSFLFSNLVAPLFKKWLIKCYKLGDQLITPTEYSKKLLDNYNMDRPIKAISNGIEVKFFERNEEAGREFRKKYGYKKNDKIIVGIGLYIKRKGILDFVELAKRLPQYKFIWFGYSPLWASPREIKKAVTTKLPNLHFAGYVDSTVIKSALSGANLYLFPTLEETEGIPIIEALISKIPTLIRDIPVFEEYEANQAVYKAVDIDDFEDKIVQIIEKKVPNLTEVGYKVAKKKDLKAVGKELIATYEEVLSPDKKKRVTKKDNKKVSKVEQLQLFTEEDKSFKIRNLALILSGVLFLIMAFFASNKYMKPELKEYSKAFQYMDSYIDVRVYTTSDKRASEAFEGIEEIYSEYEKLASRKVGGGIYQIHNNTSTSETIEIDPKLYKILESSITWHQKTNGLVNINMGNITDVWTIYRDSTIGIPTANILNSAGSIDIDDIVLLGNNTIKNTKPNIDLDPIIRGYVAGVAADYLKDIGVSSFFISTNGLAIVGDHYIEGDWFKISIGSPFKNEEQFPIGTVQATNRAIASSGAYQNAYEYDGKPYGHIISPVTKFPGDFMIGVTVVAEDPELADALATALFLMPITVGQEYIKEFDAEAIWTYITEDGTQRKLITENFYEIHQ